MSLVVVNVVAFVLILLALAVSVRRPIHATEEGRAMLVLLGSLVLLSGVGLVRRTGHPVIEGVSLGAWTAIAAVAVWLIIRRA